MAVVKATNSRTGGNLKKLINYVTKEEKTEGKYISGQDCNPQTALEEMQITKQQFDKVEGREYKHFIQSFKPGEVTADKAHKIALEWSQKHFKGYEVLIATHEDKTHIHTHFVVNSVSFEDGSKYQQSKEDLKEMKLSSDRICEREGLSVITEKSKEITSFKQSKYKAMEKAIEGTYKSYVVDTALSVNTALKDSRSKEDFIKNMENQGYSVKWTDTNKNVTFTNSEGEKVRLSNLQKTFKDERYSKEGLESEFTKLRGKGYTRGTERPTIQPGGTTGAITNKIHSDRAVNLLFGNTGTSKVIEGRTDNNNQSRIEHGERSDKVAEIRPGGQENNSSNERNLQEENRGINTGSQSVQHESFKLNAEDGRGFSKGLEANGQGIYRPSEDNQERASGHKEGIQTKHESDNEPNKDNSNIFPGGNLDIDTGNKSMGSTKVDKSKDQYTSKGHPITAQEMSSQLLDGIIKAVNKNTVKEQKPKEQIKEHKKSLDRGFER